MGGLWLPAVLASLAAGEIATRAALRSPRRFPQLAGQPGAGNCTVHWFTQRIDHFGPAAPGGRGQFQQRYFVCGLEYRTAAEDPVFFYCGNEADVTLYVNATGLMWESAPGFKAVMVFAEHRYFGESLPFGKKAREHMEYLSTEQALADYATLIFALRGRIPGAAGLPHGPPTDSAFIGFGGSYGGMLGTWLRMKYPSAIDGVIAGSAPVLSFLGESPAYDTGSYAATVTYDASAKGGAVAGCTDLVRASWQAILDAGASEAGRASLDSAFRLCPKSRIKSEDDARSLAYWAQSAMDYLSMGSYPYPSSYILNGDGVLPAYPMRELCRRVVATAAAADRREDPSRGLLEALREGVGVFYNYSNTAECFDTAGSANNATAQDALFWDYLFCSEMVQPMSRDGVHDMFFSQPFSLNGTAEQCRSQWGVEPKPLWATINYGGRRLRAASNIVWSNGFLDPWKGGGVLENVSKSLAAVVIPDVGHHIDLMFSNPLDPPAVTAARDFERRHMRRWVEEAAAARAGPDRVAVFV